METPVAAVVSDDPVPPKFPLEVFVAVVAVVPPSPIVFPSVKVPVVEVLSPGFEAAPNAGVPSPNFAASPLLIGVVWLKSELVDPPKEKVGFLSVAVVAVAAPVPKVAKVAVVLVARVDAAVFVAGVELAVVPVVVAAAVVDKLAAGLVSSGLAVFIPALDKPLKLGNVADVVPRLGTEVFKVPEAKFDPRLKLPPSGLVVPVEETADVVPPILNPPKPVEAVVDAGAAAAPAVVVDAEVVVATLPPNLNPPKPVEAVVDAGAADVPVAEVKPVPKLSVFAGCAVVEEPNKDDPDKVDPPRENPVDAVPVVVLEVAAAG